MPWWELPLPNVIRRLGALRVAKGLSVGLPSKARTTVIPPEAGGWTGGKQDPDPGDDIWDIPGTNTTDLDNIRSS